MGRMEQFFKDNKSRYEDCLEEQSKINYNMATQESIADKKIKEFRKELDDIKDKLRMKAKLQSDTYK